MYDYVISYSSISGNTRRIARAMQQALSDYQGTLIDLEQCEPFPKAKMQFIGFGIHNDRCSVKVLDAMGALPSGKVALFVTCGMEPTPQRKAELEKKYSIWLEEPEQYQGMFLCQGSVPEEFLMQCKSNAERKGLESTKVAALMKQLEKAQKHPDENDFYAAGNFANAMMQNLE